jgi:hypothetical protein
MVAGLLRLGGFEPGFPFALGHDARIVSAVRASGVAAGCFGLPIVAVGNPAALSRLSVPKRLLPQQTCALCLLRTLARQAIMKGRHASGI